MANSSGSKRRRRTATIRSVTVEPPKPVSDDGLVQTCVHQKRLKRSLTIDRAAFACLGGGFTVAGLSQLPPFFGVHMAENSPVFLAAMGSIILGIAGHIFSRHIFSEAIDLPEDVMAEVLVEYHDA